MVTFMAIGVAEGVLSLGLVRDAISDQGGVCLEEGPAAVVALFAVATAAVRAAFALQRAARTASSPHPWVAIDAPDAAIEDTPTQLDSTRARCAKLGRIARGGQVLVTARAKDAIAGSLPDGTTLVDRGAHRLGEAKAPVRVWEALHPDVAPEPGPLLSLDAIPNNMPDPKAAFIGREEELRRATEALAGTRLLTLTGAGGCGKTRLALELAGRSPERFPDGAWWVPLGQLEEAALVGQAVAESLSVRPLAGRTPLDAASTHLADSRALVVLDNCEHLQSAAGDTAAALLAACPAVTVLATSRSPLEVAGETRWRVPSLSEHDAAQLFVSRARRARPDFVQTRDDAAAIDDICAAVDRIPLALEVVAARAGMLSLDQISAALEHHFDALTEGGETELSRHDTLRASVDWSYDLLSDRGRAMLRRLAVFRGGFTLESAEHVCPGGELERVAVLDLLASLVDESLVVADETGPVIRYRLLETVRQRAHERLAEAGELDSLRDRHMDAFIALAEQVEATILDSHPARSLAPMDSEAANFRAALDRAIETDPDRALRLCLGLTRWWRLRGLFDVAERSYERALEAADPAPSALRARVLWGRAYLLVFAGNYQRAIDSAQAAVAMAEEVGDSVALARALHVLAQIQIFPDPVGSRRLLERSRGLAKASGDDYFLVAATHVLAQTYQICDDFERADELFDEVRELAERDGFRGLFAFRCLGKSVAGLMRADRKTTFAYAEQGLAASLEVGEPTTEGIAHSLMAVFENAEGRHDAAVSRLERSRPGIAAKGAGMALHYIDTVLAAAHAGLGDLEQARAGLEKVVATNADFGYWLAWTTAQLADVERVAGDAERADQRAREALEIAVHIESLTLAAWSQEVLGRLASERGEWSAAEALLHEALAPLVERELWLWMPKVLDGLALAAGGAGDLEFSARLAGAVTTARSSLGLARWAPDQPRFGELEQDLRRSLGDEAFARNRSAGAELTLEETAGWVRRARGSRKRPSAGWDSLTPTEAEVARHAAAGLSNPQIGERMFISRGTVKVHLSHIYAKLDVHNRAELAAEAARRQPPESP